MQRFAAAVAANHTPSGTVRVALMITTADDEAEAETQILAAAQGELRACWPVPKGWDLHVGVALPTNSPEDDLSELAAWAVEDDKEVDP